MERIKLATYWIYDKRDDINAEIAVLGRHCRRLTGMRITSFITLSPQRNVRR